MTRFLEFFDNSPKVLFLKLCKVLYARFIKKPSIVKPECIQNPDLAAEHIMDILNKGNPAIIARFGSTELTCIANYLAIKANDKPWVGYIKGERHAWWWNKSILFQMRDWSGFFPPTQSTIEKFCVLILQDIPQVDLLGSWLPDELLFDKELTNTVKVDLELLNPYFAKYPWTHALEGKRVLVIHPFAKTIEAQYKKRQLLFKNNLLPEFELLTIKAVQSIAGEETEFKDWFEALESMKSAMDSVEYDICLIGCGAYGFPLAAHAKRRGKIGFHIGGSLQLLFGIRGKRWENPNYNPKYNYSKLVNEHWVKPAIDETPMAAQKVEDACYW